MIKTVVLPSVVEPCRVPNNIDKFVVPTHIIFEGTAERFSQPGTFGRLHDELRNLVRRAEGDDSPLSAAAIIRTAVHHLYNARFARNGRVPTELFAFACADLAVTGRRAYFGKDERDTPLAGIDFAALRHNLITGLRTEFPDALLHDIANCVQAILDRVFQVSWCLQGPAGFRSRFRNSLGWIAVSGEDDPPHRPVNVFSSRYPQYTVEVTLAAGSFMGGTLPLQDLTLPTRILVATQSREEPGFPERPSALPPTRPLVIPAPASADRDIIIFIHGHSSRAEEFEDIAPLVLQHAMDGGRQWTMISLDLPGFGYSGFFDTEVYLGPLSHSRNIDPSLPRAHFPGLQFVEEFICRFVETLGIQDRVLAFIGGSLGGNMTLRLGRRNDARQERFIHNLVSWSAASVWDSFLEPHDPVDRAAKEIALNSAHTDLLATSREESGARGEYFYKVFIEVHDLVVYRLRRQPEHWYRDDWRPCKGIHIENALLDRQEIYHQYFRQMHWRLAIEQLIFSQNLRESGRPLYLSNTARTFLLAGEADDYDFTNIYTATSQLADHMTGTPGECMLVRSTGHSIHNERPRWFAPEIVGFLV